MDITEEVRKRSAQLRWRQGSINLILSIIAAWLFPAWDPNFLVLGLFTFGVLRLVQGTELRLGLVRGGWTDIPFTPPVIGCWAAAAVFMQRLAAGGGAGAGVSLLLWILAGVALYAAGRWYQMRYYARRPQG